jgi:hypothetical protein
MHRALPVARRDKAMHTMVIRTLRGVGRALRLRTGVFVAAAVTVLTLELLLPPIVLSMARKPVDYFAFNAWLPELPAYVFSSDVLLQRKLEFLPNVALFWFSADSPYGGVDWGFAVTVSNLMRFLLLATLFGIYFALVVQLRALPSAAGGVTRLSRGGGAFGVLASALGISSGGCTVMGCGAPVLPVIGLAFAGLTSGTLVLLAQLSRIVTLLAFLAVTLGVIFVGWRTGGAPAVDGSTGGLRSAPSS